MNTFFPLSPLKVGAIALFSAGALAGLAPAQAASVTQNFTATVDSGSFTGQVGTGTFTYDDALLINGDETLAPNDLALTFSFLGQDYTEADDELYPGAPELQFSAFNPNFLNFQVIDGSPTDIVEPSIIAFSINSLLDSDGNGGFNTTLTVETAAQAPEPSALAGLLAIGAISIAIGRRKV